MISLEEVDLISLCVASRALEMVRLISYCDQTFLAFSNPGFTTGSCLATAKGFAAAIWTYVLSFARVLMMKSTFLSIALRSVSLIPICGPSV